MFQHLLINPRERIKFDFSAKFVNLTVSDFSAYFSSEIKWLNLSPNLSPVGNVWRMMAIDIYTNNI